MVEQPQATGGGRGGGVDAVAVAGGATSAGGRRRQAAPDPPAPASILSPQRQRLRRVVDALVWWRRPRRRHGVQPWVSIVPYRRGTPARAGDRGRGSCPFSLPGTAQVAVVRHGCGDHARQRSLGRRAGWQVGGRSGGHVGGRRCGALPLAPPSRVRQPHRAGTLEGELLEGVGKGVGWGGCAWFGGHPAPRPTVATAALAVGGGRCSRDDADGGLAVRTGERRADGGPGGVAAGGRVGSAR